MLRKVYLVIECADDTQKDAVQQALNDISNMRVLHGDNIQSMYPFFKIHQKELMQLFEMIKKGGVKSLFSIQGGTLLSKLTKNNNL